MSTLAREEEEEEDEEEKEEDEEEYYTARHHTYFSTLIMQNGAALSPLFSGKPVPDLSRTASPEGPCSSSVLESELPV